MIEGSKIENTMKKIYHTGTNRQYNSISCISNHASEQANIYKLQISQNKNNNNYSISISKNFQEGKFSEKIKKHTKSINQLQHSKCLVLEIKGNHKKTFTNQMQLSSQNVEVTKERKINNNFAILYKLNLKRALVNSAKMALKKNKMRNNMHSIDSHHEIGYSLEYMRKILNRTNSNHKYFSKIQEIKQLQKTKYNNLESYCQTPNPQLKSSPNRKTLPFSLNQQLGITKFILKQRISDESIKKLSNQLLSLKMKQIVNTKKQIYKPDVAHYTIKDNSKKCQRLQIYQINPWETVSNKFCQ